MNTAYNDTVICYHVTILSNFARGFDKYRLLYSKDAIPESTFKNKFYLLKQSELHIGYHKAGTLLSRLNIEGDRLLVIASEIKEGKLLPNHRTGLGRYVKRSWITVSKLYFPSENGNLKAVTAEETMALSLKCGSDSLLGYPELKPRTISLLPVARGCQAKCPFCFSAASVSKDQEKGVLDLSRVKDVLKIAKERGAERAVITGGGEPGVLSMASLLELIKASAEEFNKVVMISNGYHLGKLTEPEQLKALTTMRDAGLNILAISRHHFSNVHNADIMHLDTQSELVARTWYSNKEALAGLTLRWVCVLQKGGIENTKSLQQYIDWAESTGIEEICFKELYVSTSMESEYFTEGVNQWSRNHQVPLKLVTDAAKNWNLVAELPWGSPIYQIPGKTLKIAAYTEPSLYWERTHGICRSWNLMADGRCLASLEDQASQVI